MTADDDLTDWSRPREARSVSPAVFEALVGVLDLDHDEPAHLRRPADPVQPRGRTHREDFRAPPRGLVTTVTSTPSGARQ